MAYDTTTHDPIPFSSKLDWANILQRTAPAPLDRTSLFETYSDAEKYAKGLTDARELSGTSYPGQIITVLENGTATMYLIAPGPYVSGQEDKSGRTLIQMGTKAQIDQAVIEGSTTAVIYWNPDDPEPTIVTYTSESGKSQNSYVITTVNGHSEEGNIDKASAETIVIGRGVTSISDLSGVTTLTSVTIASTVTSIIDACFANDTGLTTLTIPASVNSIADDAFGGCTSLMAVTFEGKTTTEVSGMTNYGTWNLPNGCVITCTDGTLTYVNNN